MDESGAVPLKVAVTGAHPQTYIHLAHLHFESMGTRWEIPRDFDKPKFYLQRLKE